jgi:hypothetical protein
MLEVETVALKEIVSMEELSNHKVLIKKSTILPHMLM